VQGFQDSWVGFLFLLRFTVTVIKIENLTAGVFAVKEDRFHDESNP
jgi:hypothetical protein